VNIAMHAMSETFYFGRDFACCPFSQT